MKAAVVNGKGATSILRKPATPAPTIVIAEAKEALAATMPDRPAGR
jgi:hypothetical protein